MDAWRHSGKIVLWLKTPEGDLRIEKDFRPVVYVDAVPEAFRILNRAKVRFSVIKRLTYLREEKSVLAVELGPDEYERFVRFVEQRSGHRVLLYDADIPPEQMFLFRNGLVPFCAVDDELRKIPGSAPFPLTKISIDFSGIPITKLLVDGEVIMGDEESVLKSFASIFASQDPDVILMDRAFSGIPLMMERMALYNIRFDFHRWDSIPLKFRGGKSFFSYGAVRYREFAFRLHGRLVVDTSTMVGQQCDVEGIAELANLTGTLFQKVASRSFGAAFQSALVREMVRDNILVPFKEKPADNPVSMFHLLKSDRAGHTFDPRLGFHTDVAQIDFCSMFPWLIHNMNISAETILSDEPPFVMAPGIPVRISMARKGLIPRAIKPILDRRMHYKRNPSSINREKASALKWLLVTCYGYLRFREFKLGIATSHMAICAFARDTIIRASRLAESRGFEVIHGIVDCLFIRKKGIAEEEVASFCKELESEFGIPVGCDGIYKWVVLLSSVNDVERPVPAHYFGVFRNNDVKARGIEVRQSSCPPFVRLFQKRCLGELSKCSSRREIIRKAPELCRMLRDCISRVKDADASALSHRIVIGRADYRHDIPQRKVVQLLRKKGSNPVPGRLVKFVRSGRGVVLPEDYGHDPDVGHYRKLLLRSLFVLLQPFGFSRRQLAELSGSERQLRLDEFIMKAPVPVTYVQTLRKFRDNNGLSERFMRKRLERNGWAVWRGGLINILSQPDLYPNVQRKYLQLHLLLRNYHPDQVETLQYLCSVHHGMPDFICFRNGMFKFVECKLGNERLSARQKKCIARLQSMGFRVEVHRLSRKYREAVVDVAGGLPTIVLKAQRDLKAISRLIIGG